LFFGYLTDRFGRKKLFIITLVLYLVATVLTAFSMNPLWFYACRFFTGAGILLFIHGRNEQAEELVGDIEREVEEETGQPLEEVSDSIRIRQRKSIGFGVIAHTAFKLYPKRTVLGLALFVGQAFLYNAVFFTQALVLSTFFGVADDVVPVYIIPFAFGNLLGPVLLGRLFDSVGRRPMITLCYVLSGLLLIGTGLLFNAGALTATTLTACWAVVFFFASAGASAAYLTGSEIFPMETRARALAFFYGVGGVTGPLLFGKLV
jgi:MFS family permease